MIDPDDLLDKALEAHLDSKLLLVRANGETLTIQWEPQFYGTSFLCKIVDNVSIYFSYKRIALRGMTLAVYIEKG